MNLIYVLGDGRSGSTLIDSFISNNRDTTSIGEAILFWSRFYSCETFCGCNLEIEKCHFWKKIDFTLKSNFDNYNPDDIKKRIAYILQYSHFTKIPEIVESPDWGEFCQIIRLFYQTIFESNQNIVDSSKDPNWLYFLLSLNFPFEIKIIHVERNLTAVANSWKKRIFLPEFPDRSRLMPEKNNFTIVKNWLKIKHLSNKIKKKEEVFFIPFEDFCYNPQYYQIKLKQYLGLDLDYLQIRKGESDHFIGGNPSRFKMSEIIEITEPNSEFKNLSLLEKLTLNFVEYFSDSWIYKSI